MTIQSRGQRLPSTSPLAGTYSLSFVRIVHRLLAAAYERLPRKGLSDVQEPAITGMIVEKMSVVLEERDAPRWAARLSVKDDPPVNTLGLRGKDRPRIDIEVESVTPGVRPRFQFEAKRLYRSGSAADYTGAEGLGCFLTGKYAQKHHAAGMLAYVQCDTIESWVEKIATKLGDDRVGHGVAKTGLVWEPFAPPDHSLPSYCSVHKRANSAIAIFHTFLACL